MNDSNRTLLDYYLLPLIDVAQPRLRLAHDNGFALDAFRFETLDPLFDLTARASFPKVA